MPPTAIGTCIPQTFDVVKNLPTKIVLNLHFRQRSRNVEDLLVLQFAYLGSWMDVEASEEPGRDIVADSEEAFK